MQKFDSKVPRPNLEDVLTELDSINQFSNLQDFVRKYFYISSEGKERNLFNSLEQNFDNERIRKYFIGILYFSLIVGFPSIDFIFQVYESEKERMSGTLSSEVMMLGFLECIYFHMSDKALRSIIFKEYLRSLSEQDYQIIQDMFVNSGFLPTLDEYSDLEAALTCEFISFESSVYNKAVAFLEFVSINKAIVQYTNRDIYNLPKISIVDRNDLIKKLFAIWKECKSLGGNFKSNNFDFYYQSNISVEL